MNPELNKIPRVLFVSDSLPPFIGGSATLMHNLFLGLDTSESILVTQSKQGFSKAKSAGCDDSVSLEIRQKKVDGIPEIFSKGSKWGFPSAALMARVPAIVNMAVKAAKEIDAQVVMTCSPSDSFVTAGWLAAQKLNLPFVVYLHDLWYETRHKALHKVIARLLEPRILKEATKVLVITPPTAEHLKGRLGIKCDVLEHSVNLQLWPLNDKIRVNHKPRKILMLGSVNKFNTDTVISFSKAIFKIPDIELTILTSQTVETLEKKGLDCSRISCFFCPRDQLKETILKADTLYLALGFDTTIPKEVEVVIPTRLMDYLPSGIPIIAHGPGNIWTIQEAKNRGWGYTIDTLEINGIKNSLLEFLSISDYEDIIQNARAEARRRDYKNMSKLLANYLNQAVNSNQEVTI